MSRTVRLYMTMSCDGFVAGPNGELAWMTAAPDPEMNRDVVDMLSRSDTGFMGYPVASGMIPYWRGVEADPAASPGQRAMAQAVNRIHAVILSNTEVDIPFDAAELVVVRDDRDLIDVVDAVKRRPGGDIGVPGGVRTARTFARLGLFDEYVLMVHPVALGEGQRLFTTRTDLRLMSARAYECGVTRLVYRPR
jgi:dihydrofolate reductase